jgi:nucleoid DNA-binding protein
VVTRRKERNEKAEIVCRIAEATELSQVQAEKAVDAVLYEIKSALQQGDSVILRRFGTFHVRAKRARIGRNPKTGEEATIAARRVVRFKSGNVFKVAVNGATAEPVLKVSGTDEPSRPKRAMRKKTAPASAKATPKQSRRTTSKSQTPK